MADSNGNGKQAPGDQAAKDEAARMEAEQRERVAREQQASEKRMRDEAAARQAVKDQPAEPVPADPVPGDTSSAGPAVDDEHAQEMERRRAYDVDRARRQAAGGVQLMVAHALAAGMPQDAIDEALEAAFSSRTPTTILTGVPGLGAPAAERSVGPNVAHLPPTPLAAAVNGPSPRAMSAMPATAGQVVRCTDPRFEGQELVDMTFSAPLTLTLDDQSQISFRAGTQPVPASLVGHWYLEAAGARRLKDAA